MTAWRNSPYRYGKQTRSQPKYGNQKTAGGYDSKFEAKYGAHLDLLAKAGDIAGWDRQVTIDIDSPITGKRICQYRVDFKVYHHDGSIEWIEVKGFATADWRLKEKLMNEIYIPQHDDESYVVVRMNKYQEPNYYPTRRDKKDPPANS